MNIKNIFTNLYENSKTYYESTDKYFGEKKKLAGMLKNSFPEGLVGDQLDNFRKSANGDLYRKSRGKAEYNLDQAYYHYLVHMQDALDSLADAVEDAQPELNIGDPQIRDILEFAKLGKNIPNETAREILAGLRTNRKLFEIVKNTMISAGSDPGTFRGILPYDGESMKDDYQKIIEGLRERSDEGVYCGLAKLQDRILEDASAFNVKLKPYIPDEVRENAERCKAASVMGLKSDYEKSVQLLEAL